MSKPSFLLIPGSFCLPTFYDPVMDAVAAKGYKIRGLHMPTVGLRTGEGREGTPTTMYDDADLVAKEVEKLADAGNDVILIAHSYGGVPVTQSTKGLGKAERQKQGKSGGIVNIAYMTAVVPALGGSAITVLADVPAESKLELKVDEAGWMYHDQPEATAAIALTNYPQKEAVALVKTWPKHSAAGFASELTHAGYKNIPVSYLLCEEDRCITPNIQRAEIEMIEKESGNKVAVTSLKADHCPNLTRTKETIDWILDVAERFAGK